MNAWKSECLRRTLLALLVGLTISAVPAAAQDRMPPLPTDKMTDAQKKAAADYKALRGMDLTTPPWTVMLRVPDLVVPALQLRLHNLTGSALNQRLTEFAIMIAARHLTNSFEWNAHYDLAIKAGLNPRIIAAISDGRRPEGMASDEDVLYDLCTELLHNKSVSDATYAKALAAFGEAGIVEAAGLEGYYTFLAMIMNTARSPSPPDAKYSLAPFPR